MNIYIPPMLGKAAGVFLLYLLVGWLLQVLLSGFLVLENLYKKSTHGPVTKEHVRLSFRRAYSWDIGDWVFIWVWPLVVAFLLCGVIANLLCLVGREVLIPAFRWSWRGIWNFPEKITMGIAWLFNLRHTKKESKG